MSDFLDRELDARILGALDDVPVFPLPNAVLFPRGLLPLHIFEPRYRAMIAHCMATNRALIIARIADPKDVDANGEPRFARVAGLGEIVKHEPLPDGRSNILVLGLARVELDEIPADTPYRRVRAKVREDVGEVTETDRTVLKNTALGFVAEVRKHAELPFSLISRDPDYVIDHCAHHLVFDPDARQALLEERDRGERLRRVMMEIAMQHRALLEQTGSPLN